MVQFVVSHVQVLLQAGIPLRASDRGDEWPPVIVGGAAVSANPLPIADFVDAAIIGEADASSALQVSADLWDELKSDY